VDTCFGNVDGDIDNARNVDGIAPSYQQQPGASPSKKTTRPETKKPELQLRLFVRPRPARLERSNGVEYRSQRSARQVLGVLGKLVLAARPPALRKK